MGTHPIFESDFDCLTEMHRIVRRPVIAAVAIGTGTFLVKNNQTLLAKSAIIQQEVPKINISPQEGGSAPIDTFKLKVYGYNGCPFCGKVRAFLNYYGFEFEDVEVNPITKAQVKEAVPGYGKVPVVEVITSDGESVFIKDSAVVISVLEDCLKSNQATDLQPLVDSYFTTDEKGKEVPIDGQKFKSNEDRKFIEDKLLHTVAPNIYPNYTEARQNCYFYMDQSDRYRNTWIGSGIAEASAAIMVPIAGRIMKKHRDFEGQTPREYLYSAADKFTKRKGDNRFLGGDYPNTADIEGYGVLCTILGTPAMDDLAFAKPVFYQWFLSVQQHVQTHQGRF